MSRAPLLAVVLIACGGGGTSLDGPYDCSGTSCTSGQVCVNIAGGIDAGSGGGPTGAHYCVSASGCDIVDCSGQMCATCIQKLCYPTSATSVSGRDVNCQGQ